MILTARIVKKGVRRLREEIQRQTGVKLLYSSNVRDIERHKLHFRYGFSLPLPYHLRHKETENNTPESIIFLKDKKKFADHVRSLGMIAPEFVQNYMPNEDDYPLLIRETLDSFGGRGIHIIRTPEEFLETWRGWYWWCPYIETKSEYRFHIGNGKKGVEIIRVMAKVPREDVTKLKKVHIRHVKHYHYSKRYNPYDKYPQWCKQIHELCETLPGWLYSLDIGVTPHNQLVFFEANTASGIDNGCARDYARFIIGEGII